MNFRLPPAKSAAPILAAILVLAATTGCTFFRNMGSGPHMDRSESRRPPTDNRTRTMVVEVTTDAQGQVANIRFVRGSGKDGIDAYVTETIRQGWPQQVSQRTVAEITYSHEKGFSQPKILSSGPA